MSSKQGKAEAWESVETRSNGSATNRKDMQGKGFDLRRKELRRNGSELSGSAKGLHRTGRTRYCVARLSNGIAWNRAESLRN